jgi:hypothetical protein
MILTFEGNFFDGQLKTLIMSGKTLKHIGDPTNTLLGKKQEITLFFFNGNQDKTTVFMRDLV